MPDTPLDIRVAQTTLENAIHDAILYALGTRRATVASIAALRAVVTRGASSSQMRDDDLIAVVTGGITTSYRWNQESVAADNGTSVIQPTDVPGGQPGRWLSWSSPMRFAPVVGQNDFALDQLTSGPLRRVLVIDKAMSEEDMLNLIAGDIPAVIVEATGDDPVDATLMTGHRAITTYEFTLYTIVQNLRDGRQAAQGSAVPNDIDPGANTIDGHLQALLWGTNLTAVVNAVRTVQLGRGLNWQSTEGQRRVVRQRELRVITSVEYPNAPNDTGRATEVDTQARMTTLDSAHDPADPTNYAVNGMLAVVASGLTQQVAAGQAVIAGVTVNYAGESHAFTAYQDTYHDLLPAGTMTFVAVPSGADPPPVTATALRIGFTRTTAAAVFASVYTCHVRTPYMNPFQTPL